MSSDRGGGLDELFAFAEEPVAEELPVEEKPRSRAGWVIRNVLLVAVATVVTIAGLRSAGVGVSVLLVVAAFVALRLLMLAVAEVAPPPAPARPGARRLTDSDNDYDYRFGDTDMLRAAVRRWEQRLDWSQSDAEQFSRSLLPVLAELTDERLRLQHGITRASDPRRARELIGEQLWQVLTEPDRRPPKARELAGYVQTLEELRRVER
jgi:hypothetical protein